MKLKKLFWKCGPGFVEISLLKYITSWKYQIEAHGVDRNVDTKTTIDIIRCLKVKKHELWILEYKHFLKATRVFFLGKYNKKVLSIAKIKRKGSCRDKNALP